MKTESPQGSSGLCGLLEEKLGKLREFFSVTESLYQQLMENNTGGWSQSLARRQNLIPSLDEIDRRIGKRQKENPLHLEPIPETLKERLEFLFKTIEGLLQKSADLNHQCLARVQFLREETKKELLAMRQGKKAAHSYTQRAGSRPRFMDVRE